MEMIVCVKQVIDPEAPPASFKVDPLSHKMVLPSGIPPVISSFDECALEAALRIKDATGGKVTVLSLGTGLLRSVVKKPLAMGADNLVLLEDEAFDGGDSWSTAYALSRAIKKIGNYDLIFCGRQADDWDAGQVGTGIAELLELPSITIAKKVDITKGKARVERITDDGHEVVEVNLPALITVSSELGPPRYTTLEGIMTANQKETTIWKPADIGVEASQVGAAGRRIELQKIFQPIREGSCEFIVGESLEEAGANLAMELRKAKIL
jgi:electron transfer flavoprotein beta subunit